MSYGTLNYADTYGLMAPTGQLYEANTAGGPNQGFVAPPFSSSGGSVMNVGNAPAISLVGIVIALVLLRVAVDMGGDAG